MQPLSLNIPFVFDFYLAPVDIVSARPGLPVDILFHSGGFTLFVRRGHLVVDIHAARACHRFLQAIISGTPGGAA